MVQGSFAFFVCYLFFYRSNFFLPESLKIQQFIDSKKEFFVSSQFI